MVQACLLMDFSFSTTHPKVNMLGQMLPLVDLLGGNDGARTHVLPNDTAVEDS